jgi:hypothetical protein
MGFREGATSWLERPDLTSETQFSRHNSSTWESLTPMMELYVRRMNLRLIERAFAPMEHETAPSRRGFINEIAFELFASFVNGHLPANIEAECVSKARRSILHLERADDLSDPNQTEMSDAREQLRRLTLFFQSAASGRLVEAKPRFSGCGIISSCEGDIYVQGELFEIKAGDRNVRSVDIRQLLIYCALNYAGPRREIQRIGLFNPRVGTHFSIDLDQLCAEISGRPTKELLSEMIQVFSSGDISR